MHGGRPKVRNYPRRSPRFPELSAPVWLRLRQQPAKAKESFAFYSDKLKGLSVLTGLQLTQRVELVALVGRLSALQRHWHSDRNVRWHLKKALKEADRRGRMTKAKLDRVAKDLLGLADYTEQFSQELWGVTLRGDGMPHDWELPHHDVLRAEAARYRAMRLRTEAEIKAEIRELGAEGRPPSTAQVAADDSRELSDYFVHICHFSKTEADVRTAKICHAVLGETTLTFREHGAGPGVGRGSPTVRSRRRRLSGRGKSEK